MDFIWLYQVAILLTCLSISKNISLRQLNKPQPNIMPTNFYSRARKFQELHMNLTVANISRQEPDVLCSPAWMKKTRSWKFLTANQSITEESQNKVLHVATNKIWFTVCCIILIPKCMEWAVCSRVSQGFQTSTDCTNITKNYNSHCLVSVAERDSNTTRFWLSKSFVISWQNCVKKPHDVINSFACVSQQCA
jgi:hypothetical protein